MSISGVIDFLCNDDVIDMQNMDTVAGDDEVTQINRVTSITRFEDYLSAPVPSTVPSPELLPAQSMNLPDLMSFEQSGTDLRAPIYANVPVCSLICTWILSHTCLHTHKRTLMFAHSQFRRRNICF